MEPLVRRFTPIGPLDLRLMLAVHRRGPRDPTVRFSADGSAWRATRTPDGSATLRLVAEGAVIRAQAWGPGAAWAIEQAPELAGALDDATGFVAAIARHRLLLDLHARLPGIRVGRTRRVLEALVPAIIEQKVTGDEARAAFVALVRRHGERWAGSPPTRTTRWGWSAAARMRSASRPATPPAWKSALTCPCLTPMRACGLSRSWARGLGASVEAVSAFLDHSSLAVTTVYLRRLEGETDRTWPDVAAAIRV
jgi:hypothetical protein